MRYAVLVLALMLTGCAGSSGSDRPDWCVGVDKATGQMANIGSGAANATATISDEAHFFDQLAGDLNDVALTADGKWAAAARQGAIDAGQVRVRLLSGQGPGSPGDDLNVQMGILGPECGD